jgi:hypothetical protein
MFAASKGLDSFDQYLQDVEKYPLIRNAAEERALHTLPAPEIKRRPKDL